MNSTACSTFALTSWDPRFTCLRAWDDVSQIMVVLFADVLVDPSLTSLSGHTISP